MMKLLSQITTKKKQELPIAKKKYPNLPIEIEDIQKDEVEVFLEYALANYGYHKNVMSFLSSICSWETFLRHYSNLDMYSFFSRNPNIRWDLLEFDLNLGGVQYSFKRLYDEFGLCHNPTLPLYMIKKPDIFYPNAIRFVKAPFKKINALLCQNDSMMHLDNYVMLSKNKNASAADFLQDQHVKHSHVCEHVYTNLMNRSDTDYVMSLKIYHKLLKKNTATTTRNVHVINSIELSKLLLVCSNIHAIVKHKDLTVAQYKKLRSAELAKVGIPGHGVCYSFDTTKCDKKFSKYGNITVDDIITNADIINWDIFSLYQNPRIKKDIFLVCLRLLQNTKNTNVGDNVIFLSDDSLLSIVHE